MKIIDILNNKDVTLSFEVFPPKTDDKYADVEQAAEQVRIRRIFRRIFKTSTELPCCHILHAYRLQKRMLSP